MFQIKTSRKKNTHIAEQTSKYFVKKFQSYNFFQRNVDLHYLSNKNIQHLKTENQLLTNLNIKLL